MTETLREKYFFWSVFSCIRTEYGDLWSKFPYSVRIQESGPEKLRIWTLFTQWKRKGLKFHPKWLRPNPVSDKTERKVVFKTYKGIKTKGLPRDHLKKLMAFLQNTLTMKSQLKQILCIPKIVSSEKLLKERVQTTQYQDNWDSIYVRETSNRITCLIYCRHYKKTVKVYEEVECSLVCLSSQALYGLCHTWSDLMQVIGFLYLFRICGLENFFYVFP